MPDFLPTPQMPVGLAEETIRLAAARGQNNPWAALAQAVGQAGEGAVKGLTARANKPVLTPDQMIAMGLPGTVPGAPLPSGQQGPIQPRPLSQVFPQGAPMSLAENMLQRKTQRDIADETTTRVLGSAGLKADSASEKLNIPVTDTTKALFQKAGLPLDDGAQNVRHEDYEAALKKVLAQDSFASKKDAAGAKAGVAQEKEWQKFAKDANLAQASSRTMAGTAYSINARADRALKSLKSKTMTNEQAAGVAADIAGILKGSTPDEQAMKEQGYGTLYSKAAGLAQFFTGKPKDAVTEPIKDKLRETIMELKEVDNKILKNHADSLQDKYTPLFKADPDRAKRIHGSVLKAAGIDGGAVGSEHDALIDKFLGGG